MSPTTTTAAPASASPNQQPGPCALLESPVRAAIEAMPIPQLLPRFINGVESFDRRLFQLTPQQLDQTFLDGSTDRGLDLGRWSIRMTVGHIADAELAYALRIRRALAEERPLVELWDHEAFIDSGIYGPSDSAGSAATSMPPPIAGFVATIHTLRRWMGELVASLSDQQLARVFMHPEMGPRTVRQTVAQAVWHLEHHAAFANRKVQRFLGPMPTENVPAGGCGPSCGCASKSGR